MITARIAAPPYTMSHFVAPVIDSDEMKLVVRCDAAPDAWCRRGGTCMYLLAVAWDHRSVMTEADYAGIETVLRSGAIDFILMGEDGLGEPHYAWFYRDVPAHCDTRVRRQRWRRRAHASEPWQQPGHFQEGDAVLFGEGDSWFPLTATADDVANQSVLPGKAARYRHAAAGCDACRTDVLSQRADSQRQRRAEYESYTAGCRDLAALFMDSLLLVQRGTCCEPDHYVVKQASALPQWLKGALAGVCLRASECGWPGLARTWDPVDWPTLIQDHPDLLRPLVKEEKASWPAICRAYRLLQQRGYPTQLDVDILIDDAEPRLLIWPTMLYAEGLRPETDQDTVDVVSATLNPQAPEMNHHQQHGETTFEWDIGC